VAASLNIKALVDWLMQSRGYSGSLWISRFEFGNDFYDGSHGSVTIRELTFSLNGQSYPSVPALQDATQASQTGPPTWPDLGECRAVLGDGLNIPTSATPRGLSHA
jgi:hypothetical protein